MMMDRYHHDEKTYRGRWYMPKTKASKRGKQASIGISREVWEWAKGNPRYESLMEELEDLEDLRREKAKKEKGIPFTDVLKEYESSHRIQLAR
jgi:hypothetical protein